MGGAVQLALCADIRIGSETLKLRIPAASLGIVYPLDAIERLVALCGPSRTKLLLLAGHTFSGDEACAAGLVDVVHPTSEFEKYLATLTETMVKQPQAALRAYKAIVDGLTGHADVAALRKLQADINGSPETVRRMGAALASRKTGSAATGS
jgi:enoyl-CoA hydratase/carnithine racemase